MRMRWWKFGNSPVLQAAWLVSLRSRRPVSSAASRIAHSAIVCRMVLGLSRAAYCPALEAAQPVAHLSKLRSATWEAPFPHIRWRPPLDKHHLRSFWSVQVPQNNHPNAHARLLRVFSNCAWLWYAAW